MTKLSCSSGPVVAVQPPITFEDRPDGSSTPWFPPMRELGLAVVIAFASYRLWALIALDTITKPFRKRLFNEIRAEKELFKWMKLWLMCPWCAGSWITAGVTAVADLVIEGGIASPVLVGVAAAAGTALLGGNDDRLMAADAELD
jgi:hypothetical protein